VTEGLPTGEGVNGSDRERAITWTQKHSTPLIRYAEKGTEILALKGHTAVVYTVCWASMKAPYDQVRDTAGVAADMPETGRSSVPFAGAPAGPQVLGP
jgi:hypothetical protein